MVGLEIQILICVRKFAVYFYLKETILFPLSVCVQKWKPAVGLRLSGKFYVWIDGIDVFCKRLEFIFLLLELMYSIKNSS